MKQFDFTKVLNNMNDLSSSEVLAKKIRKISIEMVYQAKASHIGGALSMVDILAVLYNRILKYNPSDPLNVDRDRFLLSKGHACSSLYATLALVGFMPLEHLKSYAQNGSNLLSHTSHHISGIEVSAGSLGHALPVSCGLALAAKRNNSKWRTYCLLSDGELDEGSNWESILFAPQANLDNLIIIIDYNKIQSLGHVVDVINLEPIKEKFLAFNWEAYEVDGHNHQELFSVFEKVIDSSNNKPKVIIAHTIKGKGVSFMENQLIWHYRSPHENEYLKAIDEIEKT
jgi:transketolase